MSYHPKNLEKQPVLYMRLWLKYTVCVQRQYLELQNLYFHEFYSKALRNSFTLSLTKVYKNN